MDNITKVCFIFYFLNILFGVIFIAMGSPAAIASFACATFIAWVLSRDPNLGGR